jgi:hypothetical protein
MTLDLGVCLVPDDLKLTDEAHYGSLGVAGETGASGPA